MRRTSAVLATLTLVASGLALTVPVRADRPPGRETFSGFAIDMGGMNRRTSSSHVTITIDRWSSVEEHQRLVDAFKEKGADALFDALQKIKPLGRISTPGSIGYDIHYAYQVPLATGGRRIVIGTDRPQSYWERVHQPRSADYPYTFIEMRLDSSGKGQGNMTVATKVHEFGETMDLENYDLMPVRLSSIRATTR